MTSRDDAARARELVWDAQTHVAFYVDRVTCRASRAVTPGGGRRVAWAEERRWAMIERTEVGGAGHAPQIGADGTPSRGVRGRQKTPP